MTESNPNAPDPGSALAELRDDPSSRKRFLRMAGTGVAGSLAVMLAACGSSNSSSSSTGSSSGSSSPSGPSPTPSSGGKGMAGDLKILNYALTLEYLEATFYQQVIASGIVKDKKVAELAKAFGDAEQQHVDALTKTIQSLGGTPATKPKTKFEPVLKMGLTTVLKTAATVENLGAAAYLGQAPKIKNKDILKAALSIHTVEARHAAALNMLVGRGFKGKSALEGSIPDGPFAAPMQMAEVLKTVQPYIA